MSAQLEIVRGLTICPNIISSSPSFFSPSLILIHFIISMQQQELNQQKQSSKLQRAHAMNLTQQQPGKELNSKSIANQLNAVSQKNDQRKYNQNEIEFLVNEFAIPRNKAVNLLRRMELKQAVKLLIHS